MIGSGQTVHSWVEKNYAKSVLMSGITAAVLGSVVGGAEGATTAAGIFQNMIQVGGPVMIGNLVGGLIITPPATGALSDLVYLGLISGAVATGVSMYAGVLPVLFDMQTANFVLMVTGSTTIGYFAATLL